MRPDPFQVALIGPESTGKTTLCRELAELYKTVWVPEFARDYIGGLNRPYTKDDIIYCAKKQLDTEEQLAKKANKILFSDTELIVLKVWLIDRFNECPEWIDKKIDEKRYDLYLLTRPDIPFVRDSVRENPHRREYFFDWYRKELEKRKFNYVIIEGFGKERKDNAIKYLNQVWDGENF